MIDLTKTIFADDSKDTQEVSLSKTVKVYWSLKSNIFVVFDEEMKTKTECKHDDVLIAVEKINDSLFFTVSKDNVIKVWEKSGELYGSFEKHTKKIIGIEILYDGILSISSNDFIYRWDFDGYERYEIDSKISSLDKIQIGEDFFQLLDDIGLSIYDIYDGSKIKEFKSKTEFINGIKILSSEKIFTKDISGIKLWNNAGEEIKEIDFDFDFDNVIETKEYKIIILTTAKSIVILDKEGNTLSDYTPNEEIIEKFGQFVKARVKLEEVKQNKNKIEQFEHIYNPYEKGVIAKEEIKKQKLDFDNKHKRLFWDFFNRPVWKSIEEALKKEEKEATIYKNIFNISAESINYDILQKGKELKKLKTINKYIIIFAILSIIAGGVSGYLVNPMGYGIFGFSLILLFIFFNKLSKINKLKTKIKQLENQILTINIVFPEISKFINDIKIYRNNILRQLPIFKNPNLYEGIEIQKIMEDLIHNSLYQEALTYCGLVQNDIIHYEGKAIIIKNGSFLQSNTSRINEHNLKSFWKTKDGNIIFAVQYIQYIFLTIDKIDIFSTHYDFIQDKFINKEAQAFYYKDVTNISKKEIERELLNKNTKALATEISLKVASGDKMEFTILNSDTFNELNSDMENISNHTNEIKELEKEYKAIENSSEYDSEEEKQEELEYIEKQIQLLRANESLDHRVKFSMDEVHMAIQNIRAQIKKHKN